MEALYLLVPLSVVAIFGAAWVFLRAADDGQFDDLDGPGWSVLHDDDRPPAATSHAGSVAAATRASRASSVNSVNCVSNDSPVTPSLDAEQATTGAVPR